MAKKKKQDESQGEIAWETAEVQGGNLVVDLSGEPSAAWSKRVAEIVERLDRSGPWGAVKITRKAVKVSDVPAARAQDLRHLLESAVQQANADFAPSEDRAGDDDAASREDAELTETFRAFANPGDVVGS